MSESKSDAWYAAQRDQYLQDMLDGKPVSFDQIMSTFTGGDNMASDIFAFLNKAQFEDWKKRSLPMAEELIGMTTYGQKDPKDFVRGQVAEGVTAAQRGYQNSQKMADQTLERYGMQQSGGQQGARDRRNSVGMAAAAVDAANRTRQNIRDTDMKIAFGGGMALPGQSLTTQRLTV